MSKLDAMTYEELIEHGVPEEVAQAIIDLRTDNELDGVPDGEWDDDEWEAISNSRTSATPVVKGYDSFTAMSEDDDLLRTLDAEELDCVQRWVDVEYLRVHYADFKDFLEDCMTELMGFNCSDLQKDIGDYLQSDVQYGMIQAQRSQAKSTIVAIFAVWQLIHDCKHRILIVSAGSDVALEIANWVIQIIMNWDILIALRPDRQHGDRASSKAFDINWKLKGPEKSPSVACIGITANMQGRRADLLIPDDIESSKNGTTEVQRAALEHLSKDFTSICQKGRIIYLGTPQTVDSIYNNLPARGYDIRVWTGRVPTQTEAKFYGDTLAPYIKRMMVPENQDGFGLDGTRGAATDPVIVNEEALTKKELDQGPAYFNLQHMLNTEMSDENRHPLKPKNLIVMNFGMENGPATVDWMPSPQNQIDVTGKYTSKPQLYRPFTVSSTLHKYEGKTMYVDTAGGGKNGDETVAAVTYFLHGYIFLAEIMKFPGGHSPEVMEQLSALALKHRVNDIEVERNFGYGMFASVWRPILMREYNKAGLDHCPVIEDVWESGQKELRIIDTLEPVMARHKLIIHEDIIEYDLQSVAKYPIDSRETYKFLHQMAKISRDKGALIHDDAIDAVAGAVRKWLNVIAVDEVKRSAQKETEEILLWAQQWLEPTQPQTKSLGTMHSRFKFNKRKTKR